MKPLRLWTTGALKERRMYWTGRAINHRNSPRARHEADSEAQKFTDVLEMRRAEITAQRKAKAPR